eukprot:4145074-Pleurochrysis_carterae.AAC.1
MDAWRAATYIAEFRCSCKIYGGTERQRWSIFVTAWHMPISLHETHIIKTVKREEQRPSRETPTQAPASPHADVIRDGLSIDWSRSGCTDCALRAARTTQLAQQTETRSHFAVRVSRILARPARVARST